MTQLKVTQLLGLGLILNGAAVAPAAATEWRFCIAPANQEHRIYMTPPLPATIPMEVMESNFHQALDHAGRRHDSVQCARAPSEQAAQTMRQHAEDFNRQLGNEVIGLDWKPPAGR